MAGKACLVLLVVFLLSSSILISGCSTARGLGTGLNATAAGVADDAKALWEGMLKLDSWMKKNLW